MVRVEAHAIEADGAHVHAVTWDGRRGGRERPPLLLLHGLGGSHYHWILVGNELAARLETRVTALDLAGFGLTRAVGRPATIERNCDIVADVLRREGPGELAGISMGGAMAIRLAARHPELVLGATLLGAALPHYTFGLPARLAGRNVPAALPGFGPFLVALYGMFLTPEQIVEDRLRASILELDRVDPRVRSAFVELASLRREFPEGPRAYADAARSLFCYLATPWGLLADAQRVRCPVHVIHGDEDRLVGVDLAHAIVAWRRDWHLDVIERCGHLPAIEYPGRVVDLIVARRELRAAAA